MSKLKKNYYFVSFSELAKYSLREAELLNEIIIDYDNRDIKEELNNMHEIEHQADTANHTVIFKLIREFITPIEREDIIAICQTIDNVTDAIEDVLLCFYMYNVKKLRPELVEFSRIVIDSCKALVKAFDEFHDFKKSTKLRDYIVEVNNLEEKADRLYTEAVRKLYVDTVDPIELIIWDKVLLQFENCCDACEDVADVIESVIMKNI
ncbi:MAG: DUF47 family protein [Bacilli bacterium]|jgi:predicted phosphate transport protein (TIGR00153 family)|nr:DUF47 family protein [Bacillota bacterium]NLM32227.1 DUF47 family protein [Acholeplasmataceae bacterium]HPZ27013.1 DUF47 family protein [Bacilli bacterium]HQC89419.1 DUF47 family protein [Bacilli bacterium]